MGESAFFCDNEKAFSSALFLHIFYFALNETIEE